MDRQALKTFLDRKVKEYNAPSFVTGDPVSVPHRFTKKQDIEIAGFFAAIFAWGNRTTIIRKAAEVMELMDNAPYEFIIHHEEFERRRFENFCHRTFNATDLLYFISFLQQHYRQNDSLESAFVSAGDAGKDPVPEPIETALNHFYRYFFSMPHVPARTRKHIAAPSRHSACKRLNMFLRWMVRSDNCGVDFGIWTRLKPPQLICPLDLHVARVAKRFGLITRPGADWLAAVELTTALRQFDPDDPAKYDFALFTLGAAERF